MRSRDYRFLDQLAEICLLILAGIPFAQVVQIGIGFATVDCAEILLCCLLVLFLLIIANRGLLIAFVPYVAVVFSIALCYVVLSIAILGASPATLVGQGRLYLPFLVACLALITPLYLDVTMLLRKTAIAVAVSATIAVVIFLFFPDFLRSQFSSSRQVVNIMLEGGRMRWDSMSLTPFVLAALMLRSVVRRVVVVAAVLACIGVVFTQNRTIALELFAFYVVVETLVHKKVLRSIATPLILGGGAVAAFLLAASTKMISLLQTRFFLGENPAKEIGRSLLQGRLHLYVQYVARISDSLPFGQGLGKQFATTPLGTPVFTSDISVVSFLLPFGVPGVLMLLAFVLILRKVLLSRRFGNGRERSEVLISLLWVSLFASLNVDLFSRNVFVLYLAVLSICHYLSNAGGSEVYLHTVNDTGLSPRTV